MVKYSDLSKYNTNVSEIATKIRPKILNQEGNGEIMPEAPNNTNVELIRPDTGSPVILRKETLASEVMNDEKINNKEEQSMYAKNNLSTNRSNATNLDETVQYESIASQKTNRSETVSKADFAVPTPSVTVPQNNTVNTENTTLKNSTPGPSHSRPFSEGNNSNSQDNTNISNTRSSKW